jgi:hypothetical protein
MATYDEILSSLGDMDLGELSLLQSDLANITKEKAMKELFRREEEINQLRLMAGMKKKPFKKEKTVGVLAPSQAPSQPQNGVRRGPKPGAKAAKAAAAAAENPSE